MMFTKKNQEYCSMTDFNEKSVPTKLRVVNTVNYPPSESKYIEEHFPNFM
jgi:hypothetical protein